MRYLVLYKENVTGWFGPVKQENRRNDWLTTWEEFDDKEDAIEFAIQNRGAIVEAFEFDTKKGTK